ncbi:Mu-like prophage FluMu major head subunit [uncultured Desulfobacterium sp.]|uniref:Mu-like prophage FluMu major head subunit n=1 Tax=uncultured Desulfobacterium sp. TaxID=201089 RepID=A0A445MWN0_9BACT|nr:Mu-like prophage FluMu major head subunit [uncultured Desulfobacterium sp.]
MIVNQANLSGIYNSFSTVFNQAFDQAPSQWPLVAMEVPTSAKTVDYKWLGDYPMMREWIGDRVIKDLSGFKYEITNKAFESTIELDRDDVEYDQIGVYTPVIQGLAQAAKAHPDILVFGLLAAGFATLCYDGQYYFDTDHPVGDGTASNDGGGSGAPWFLLDLRRAIKPVILQINKRPEFVRQDKPEDESVFMRKKFRYGVDDRKNVGFGLWQIAYGSKDTLDATNYAAARAAMMGYTKDDGVTKLGIVPTHLVYGPTNESAARTLIVNERNAAGASNPWYKTVEPALVPWLA